MSLSAENKQEIIKKFAVNKDDTGSSDVQVALLTARIEALSAHLKSHPKDKHSTRGLLMMVGQRRRLLDYIKRQDEARYQALIKALELRR